MDHDTSNETLIREANEIAYRLDSQRSRSLYGPQQIIDAARFDQICTELEGRRLDISAHIYIPDWIS